MIDLATGEMSDGPAELAGLRPVGTASDTALFAADRSEPVTADERAALLDLETFETRLVPYPEGALGRTGAIPLELYVTDDGPHVGVTDQPDPFFEGVLAHRREVTFWHEDAQHLIARNGLGEVIWERPDLLPIGGEGFHSSTEVGEGDEAVFLVNACTEPGQDPSRCGAVLAGLSAVDGRTVWQLDGARAVPIVEDGFAVVSAGDGYEMIDVLTGERVPGTTTWGREDFASECCGGGDHFHVGHEGAVAWTMSADYWGVGPGPHVKVWYPAGTGDGTVTVDLLGGSAGE